MSPVITELKLIVEKDRDLSSVSNADIVCLGYCPELGHRAWVFTYKGEYVYLYDAGNGYYDFGGELNDIATLSIV